ncbi:MAG: FAD:protein FMN transferase [Planctomycetaceae bacterium]
MRCLLIGVFLLAEFVAADFGSLTLAGERLEIEGSTMGTGYSIVIDTPAGNAIDPEKLKAKIEARLVQINDQMSTWDPKSEISRFNQSESTDWFDVSPEFASVVTEARRVHELSAGAFDPTLAPLINLWGFGDDRPQTIPDDAAIAEAKQSVGMQHLSVRSEPPALKKAIPELQLNLSAIAKGYGVDAIAELLIAEGLPAFIVDIGGEDRAGKAKASGDAWKLGVESPLGGLNRVLPLTEMSIATSGDYRNFFQVDGVTYSHAIDPNTGRPVKNPPASVSVLHESCMTADAWATTMMIVGPEEGTTLASQNNLSVFFQSVVNDSIAEVATGVFLTTQPITAAPAESTTDPAAGNSQSERAGGLPWFPFAAAAIIFLIAIAGMAIGTMLQNKSIKGSCGGLANTPGSEGKSICELCTIPKDQCTNAELREQMQAAAASQSVKDQSELSEG